MSEQTSNQIHDCIGMIGDCPNRELIERLRAGLTLIATDEHRLMNTTARQSAASILSGKPIGGAVETPAARCAHGRRREQNCPFCPGSFKPSTTGAVELLLAGVENAEDFIGEDRGFPLAEWCQRAREFLRTAVEPAAVEMLPLRCGNPECGCAAMEEPKTKSTPFFKGTVTFGDTAYAHDGEGGVAVKTSEPSPSLRCKTCGGMAVTGEYCSDPCKMASNRCKNCGIAVGESADYCSDHCERRTAMS